MVLETGTGREPIILPIPSGSDLGSWAQQLVAVLQPLLTQLSQTLEIFPIYDQQGRVLANIDGLKVSTSDLVQGSVSSRVGSYTDVPIIVSTDWVQIASVTTGEISGSVLIIAKAFKDSGGDCELRLVRGTTLLDTHAASASPELGPMVRLDADVMGIVNYSLEARASVSGATLSARSIVISELKA